MKKVYKILFIVALTLAVQAIIFFLAAKVTADATCWYLLWLNGFIALALFGIALVLSIFMDAKREKRKKMPKMPCSGKYYDAVSGEPIGRISKEE